MNVLLIHSGAAARQAMLALLEEKKVGTVLHASSLQEGIEWVEANPASFALIICDYPGKSSALLKCFAQVSSVVPCIFLASAQELPADLIAAHPESIVERVGRGDLEELGHVLDQLRSDGLFRASDTPDSDFVRVKVEGLVLHKALRTDIFIRLAPGRYCRRFTAHDGFDAADMDRHFRKKGLDSFYLRRGEISEFVQGRSEKIGKLLADPHLPEKVARDAVNEAFPLVHNVVTLLGFTPQTQELAKRTVNLLVKAIGNSPKLSEILTRLNAQDGKYIASHSLMQAEVACAIASRIGLNSATTFLKLGLAAFVHDLSLADNDLARLRSLDQFTPGAGFSAAQLQEFKFHPIKCAEYTRQFHQIPPDVDTIVIQHHEKPDGTGFPRGLYHHQISPLSCIFIVAQDLLDYFHQAGMAGDEGAKLNSFLALYRTRYGEGVFRRVHESLISGNPLQL